MTRVLTRSLAVLIVVTVVQFTVALDVRVGGAAPDLLYLLPIAAGMVAGTVEGAVVGFVAGLTVDLLSPGPLGLSALVLTLLGAAVGLATGSLARQVWWLSSLVALVASATAVMLYAVLGAVLGEDQFLHVGLLAVVLVVSMVNAALALPALRIERWALDDGAERVPAGGRR
jgi:rod shape-determining protein MreD